MKEFKEGQIVKAKFDTDYMAAGEIAEVQMAYPYPENDDLELCLVFSSETMYETKWPCSETEVELFDFYEKVE